MIIANVLDRGFGRQPGDELRAITDYAVAQGHRFIALAGSEGRRGDKGEGRENSSGGQDGGIHCESDVRCL